MPDFKFRLQSVLNIKKANEKIKLEEMGLAMKKLQEQIQILNEIYSHISDKTKEFYSSENRSLKAYDFTSYSKYFKHLNEKLIEQKKNVKFHEDNVDKVRRELNDAVKERKVYDKHKQNKQDEFNFQSNSDEQKKNNDIASYNFFNARVQG